MTKAELIKELRFCKDLMERLEEYAIANYSDAYIGNNHTVIQHDLIRLRRELNEIRIKLGGMVTVIIDLLICALSGCSAVFGVLDFMMGCATHSTEWYLKAIFAILFAYYLGSITKR